MMFWSYGYGWPMFWNMLWWSIVFLALVAIGIWAVTRWMNSRPDQNGARIYSAPDVSATEILRQRYARGEINEETFERMKAHLDAPVRTL